MLGSIYNSSYNTGMAYKRDKKDYYTNIKVGGFSVELPYSCDIDATYETKEFRKELNEKSINQVLKLITNRSINELNNIVKDKTVPFDEIIIFRLDTNDIESIGNPFFVGNIRLEQEGYNYKDEAKRLISIFKDNYKEGSPLFNIPIYLEDAYATEFDIMVILDCGFIVFFNKKNGTIDSEEIKKIERTIKDSIYLYKIKIQEYLDLRDN